MKILGQILVWGSLAVGAMAAATAYLVSLDASDEQILGLTLADPAGSVPQPDGKSKPIAEKDAEVTAELLDALRAAGVANVRVKEFSLGRWRGKTYFLLSLVGLALGAWLTRRAGRPAAAGRTDRAPADPPDRILATIRDTVDALRSQLPDLPDRAARLEAVVETVGQLQKAEMAAFVDARPQLTRSLGLAGYAALMDSYAAAERQLNRAWSAAVDTALEEAVSCLDEASLLLEDTGRRVVEPRTTR